MTAFHALTPMLRTQDLQRSIAFYVDVLGFSLQSYSEGDGWAALRCGGVELMLSGLRDGEPAPALTGSLYFRLADAAAVDALWETLQARVRCCYPPEDFHYCMREFGVFDDDGYLLQFGAPSANA